MLAEPWEFYFAFVGSVGSIATAIAVVFLGLQLRQTQKQIELTQEQTNMTMQQLELVKHEMENTLRAWVGTVDVTIQDNTFVTFELKNYGRIPAKIVSLRNVFNNKKISLEQLRTSEPEDRRVMLFPDAIQKISLLLPEQRGYVYFAIMIEYEYAKNKNGEYGLIAKRLAGTENIIYEKIFAN